MQKPVALMCFKQHLTRNKQTVSMNKHLTVSNSTRNIAAQKDFSTLPEIFTIPEHFLLHQLWFDLMINYFQFFCSQHTPVLLKQKNVLAYRGLWLDGEAHTCRGPWPMLMRASVGRSMLQMCVDEIAAHPWLELMSVGLDAAP